MIDDEDDSFWMTRRGNAVLIAMGALVNLIVGTVLLLRDGSIWWANYAVAGLVFAMAVREWRRPD